VYTLYTRNRKQGDEEWCVLFRNLTMVEAIHIIIRQGTDCVRNGWKFRIVREVVCLY
jgi:hypothetical protein